MQVPGKTHAIQVAAPPVFNEWPALQTKYSGIPVHNNQLKSPDIVEVLTTCEVGQLNQVQPGEREREREGEKEREVKKIERAELTRSPLPR